MTQDSIGSRADQDREATGPSIAFDEALRVWIRVALLSFGGPAGQIATMNRILVDEKKWIAEDRFLHALNFCMLLPGPEAQQLAIYIGWLLHRIKGGLVAGILFVLPGAAAMMALSWLYVLAGRVAPVAALFFGLKAAVVAIVFHAVHRIARRALTSWKQYGIAASAFVALFLLQIPFPAVISAAALLGLIGGIDATVPKMEADRSDVGKQAKSQHVRVWLIAALLLLWLAPMGLLHVIGPPAGALGEISSFFSRLATVSFGGAYAALSWAGQVAVDHYHWLTPHEMLDGLGLAESTPGPLIIVTQHIGFLAAYRSPGVLPPLLAGTLGGLITTWAIFTPCFLWVFLGAPYVERLRRNRTLGAALSGITAAVVGVILNLGLWFALHFWFGQVLDQRIGPLHVPNLVWASLDPSALLLSFAALAAAFLFRRGTFAILGGCAVAGLVLKLV